MGGFFPQKFVQSSSMSKYLCLYFQIRNLSEITQDLTIDMAYSL